MDFKFKVGDRVKVARRGSVDWADPMDGYIGGHYIINSCEECGCPRYEGYTLAVEGATCYLDWYFCVDSLELVAAKQEQKIDMSNWNCLCKKCGSPAYQGLMSIECSNKACS